MFRFRHRSAAFAALQQTTGKIQTAVALRQRSIIYGRSSPSDLLEIIKVAQLSANDPIVILSYARTPMGGLQGALAGASATDLGAAAVGAAVERAGVSGEEIERIRGAFVRQAMFG
jgi:hypothetical protein